jgi:hypothetical protein
MRSGLCHEEQLWSSPTLDPTNNIEVVRHRYSEQLSSRPTHAMANNMKVFRQLSLGIAFDGFRVWLPVEHWQIIFLTLDRIEPISFNPFIRVSDCFPRYSVIFGC